MERKLIWITDEVVSKRIFNDIVIPEGWKVGRHKTGKPAWNRGVPQTKESNEKRRQKLLGRESPNKGNASPKKGLTEVEYYGEEKAAELARSRSEVHSGQTPWNLGIPHTEITKAKIGLANEFSQNRSSVRYRRWADSVLKNDGNSCQHCGTRKHRFGQDQDLYAHHVKGWEEFIELRFITSNGLTLCNSCHPRLENTLRVLKRNSINLSTVILSEGVEICSVCHRLLKSEVSDITTCKCNNVNS